MSIQDATDEGWIRPSDPPPVWYHTWDYLRFNKVAWEALPSQTLTLISMIFVVALSSSLDVAAIELELQRPLNYNSELTMVGLSNVVSGLTGGYTGSYIFSQSIFCLRAGIRSRLAGFILAFVEMIVILLPFPILAYVPNFFFGSLLIMICVDLLHEWLWEVRYKLTTIEYSVCLATFVLIQLLGVEYGIFTGVGLYLVAAKLQCPLRQGTLEEVSLSTEQVTDKANNYYGTL
jgi:MFS superfamily sulfate permease-like transporter